MRLCTRSRNPIGHRRVARSVTQIIAEIDLADFLWCQLLTQSTMVARYIMHATRRLNIGQRLWRDTDCSRA
jgi:hypothetical protein